jgi:PAS domain S-box-containing protein
MTGGAETEVLDDLRRARDFSQALLDGFPAPVWRSGPDGACEYVNAAWMAFTGRGPDEELGSGWTDGVHPDDLPRWQQAVAGALDDHAAFGLTYRLRDAQGRWREVTGEHRPVIDADGVVVGYVGVLFDLTELRTTARDLAQQRHFLSAVLDNLTDAVVACDADGVLTLFNPAAARLHGVPAEPIPFERWAEHYDLFAGDGRTPLRAEEVPLLRALRGEDVRDVEMSVVARGCAPRLLLASGQQIVDDDGDVRGAVVAMHDVTEQRAAERLRAERASREQEQRAAEDSLRRLRALNDAAVALSRSRTMVAALQACTEHAARIVGARQAISSLTQGEDWSQAVTAVVLGEEYSDWQDYDQPPDGSGIYALVCETNTPVRMTQEELERHPRWRAFGGHADAHPPMRGWLAAPLVGRDGGNLGLVQLTDKRAPDGGEADFDEQDEAVLLQLTQLASVTLEKALAFEREHNVAVELQRSLLPASLPDIAGVQAHAEYRPGGSEEGLSVGGDWYDVFELDDGWVALALGDVVGHGLRSATLMGQIRSALRGIAMQEPEPPAVMAALDRLVASLGGEPMATLAYATLHPASGRLRLVLAGHPAPLVRDADGVRVLDVDPGLPLGALPGGRHPERVVELAPGATVLLFSDGLVESRRRGVGDGVTELARAFDAGPSPLSELCAELLAQLTSGGHEDDVALLAVRLDDEGVSPA